MNLVKKAQAAFASHFPNEKTPPRLFRAPGRVNLIGEHTDYNDGFVLPVAINFETVIAATPRADGQVCVFAVDEGQEDRFDLGQPIRPHADKMWANYVRGMAKILLAEEKRLAGVNMVIAGNVPRSGGLSSSASLEMAVGHTFLQMSGPDLPGFRNLGGLHPTRNSVFHSSGQAIDGVALALSGQKAENDFVGVSCGIMDQFVSSLGRADHALLIDCRDLSYRPVRIPDDTAIIVVDSGIKRGLVGSEYNRRRQECETAAAHFGVKALRDLNEATLQARAQELSSAVLRRARHVITENARTLAAAEALARAKMDQLGPLMAQSHESMRDDFEITVPAIDTLVGIMQSVSGIYGARMTGGGFGGCCVALSPRRIAPLVSAAIEAQYETETGYKAKIYTCQASAGAGETKRF